MVEKVFISPNRVRAYGNIVNMKTGDDFTLVNSELTVTTDMVDGAEMTVFQFEVEGGISIALTSSSSTCNVGDNVLLTATVMNRSTPVEAAEVTFKVGETVLGTDETDANGVATYTYAASTAGSFNFTASYQTSTSNSVSVTVNHSYSLAFSQATYTASGGSATLECTLLEDNVAKSGASITVTGSDGSLYNGITNSQGIASVTVSNISTATTFTASYSNVSDTCTVTVGPSYLFYDSGVTGTKNTNFIFNGTTTYCQVTTDANGTIFLFTSVGQGDYIPNIDISQYANLEISWIFTYGTRYACQTTLLNSNKTSPNDRRWHNAGTSTPTNQWYTPNGRNSITHTLTVGDTMKLVKTNNTFSFYCNDELISTVTPSFTVVYIGFTSADNNRPFGYKELKIAETL